MRCPASQHLAELYGGLFDGSVAWGVMPQCVLTWLSLLLITTLDSPLMLTTTETVVAIDIDCASSTDRTREHFTAAAFPPLPAR